jgi:hypothetical protein
LVDLQQNFARVRIHSLVTIGAVNMIESDSINIKASDNQAVDFHPRWSQIAVFDPRQYTNPCTEEPDNTNPTLPAGVDLPVRLENDGLLAYLSIVNGCPYDFEFLSSHQWQMVGWDGQWVTIPAGKSLSFSLSVLSGRSSNQGPAQESRRNSRLSFSGATTTKTRRERPTTSSKTPTRSGTLLPTR